jgi:hypothetical protein
MSTVNDSPTSSAADPAPLVTPDKRSLYEARLEEAIAREDASRAAAGAR